jgi:hypothetical protein
MLAYGSDCGRLRPRSQCARESSAASVSRSVTETLAKMRMRNSAIASAARPTIRLVALGRTSVPFASKR